MDIQRIKLVITAGPILGLCIDGLIFGDLGIQGDGLCFCNPPYIFKSGLPK